MQITLHIRRQGREPTRAVPSAESALEAAGVAGVVDDVGDEARGGGGEEDGEYGGGRERAGEGVGEGAEREEHGWVGGEGG